MPTGLEKINCPICNSSNYNLYKEIIFDDNYYNLPNYKRKKFNIVKCNDCSLVYVNPRVPEDTIKKMYNKNLQSYDHSDFPSKNGYIFLK